MLGVANSKQALALAFLENNKQLEAVPQQDVRVNTLKSADGRISSFVRPTHKPADITVIQTKVKCQN